MAYWLFKSEPDVWSFEMQMERGDRGEHWDGVRNHLAKKQMMAMEIGDHGFFYHSNIGKEIVGIVEVIREFYPDHTDPSGRFGMVDIKAVEPLKNPVTLAQIKAEPRLAEMALVKQSRLSVQPVTEQEWEIVLEMAGMR